jgi:hypothetical protein
MKSSPDRIVLGYAGLMDMILVTADVGTGLRQRREGDLIPQPAYGAPVTPTG